MSNAMSKCGCTTSASFENKKDDHEPGPQTGTTPELASTARGSHPTLLLMAGFAGAGKTTLAAKLKEEFLQCGDQSWEVLDKDLLKRKYLEEGQEVELAGWKAFEDLFNLIAQKAINNKKSVIIDTSNERPFIHENILTLLEHFPLLVMTPTCSDALNTSPGTIPSYEKICNISQIIQLT